MGQQQIKISTSNHVVTLLLNKRNNLEILAYKTNKHRQLVLQHNQEYMFLELPGDVQQEFHTMKRFLKDMSASQGTCCTGGLGLYKVEFQNGNLTLKKNNSKTLTIPVQKTGSSENITIEFEEKVVSLQDRLERQISNQRSQLRHSGHDGIDEINAVEDHTVPLEKHFFKMESGYYLSLCTFFFHPVNLNANIMNSIRLSALNPSVVTHLDLCNHFFILAGNKLTSKALEEILGLNWTNLKKLSLDDNLLESSQNIEKLQTLTELSLSKNLLQLDTAQHFSRTKFNELKFLKISFYPCKENQKCWQALWSNEGRNFPKLQKLVIGIFFINKVCDKILPGRIQQKFENWKNGKTSEDKIRQVVYEVKDLEKLENDKVSYLRSGNALRDYPEMD